MVEEPCLAGPKIQMAQGFGPYTPGAGVLSEDSLPAAHVTLLRSSLHTALRCASHISLHTRDWAHPPSRARKHLDDALHLPVGPDSHAILNCPSFLQPTVMFYIHVP